MVGPLPLPKPIRGLRAGRGPPFNFPNCPVFLGLLCRDVEVFFKMVVFLGFFVFCIMKFFWLCMRKGFLFVYILVLKHTFCISEDCQCDRNLTQTGLRQKKGMD